ncbi:MAG: hypothetical protein ACAH12_03060 [Methylophilaceae bacterium]|uniref:hypothetical protein n=1 Tax=Methylovorus sp. MM2 TaxID=1848038 RepID=UPI0013F4E604|nr:hypothetical protein [Methylovorus sp. MM2]
MDDDIHQRDQLENRELFPVFDRSSLILFDYFVYGAIAVSLIAGVLFYFFFT